MNCGSWTPVARKSSHIVVMDDWNYINPLRPQPPHPYNISASPAHYEECLLLEGCVGVIITLNSGLAACSDCIAVAEVKKAA